MLTQRVGVEVLVRGRTGSREEAIAALDAAAVKFNLGGEIAHFQYVTDLYEDRIVADGEYGNFMLTSYFDPRIGYWEVSGFPF